MKSEGLLAFSLSEISKWQLDYSNSNVELPALQRGFVWKANQIEALWDSLLRGFPIGSLLLSRSADDHLFLLDGQQRATSIAIGYYNPWLHENNEAKRFWSLKDVPVVWIDLDPKQKTQTQYFVLRVVTRSHPWGYQRVNHGSVLSIVDRRKALSVFKEISNHTVQNYFKLSLMQTFPYDSDLPVPLSFLIRAVTLAGENWREKLLSLCKEHLPAGIRTKYFEDGNTMGYFKKIEEVLNSERYKDIYSSVKNLERIKIPGIVISQEILKADDEQSGVDPTLFVRLNSSGTRIGGDELIYSIYKASFPEAKQLVENIGASFVAPPLVISLISRLVISALNDNKYPYGLSVNEFRRKIKDPNFKSKLIEFIGDNTCSPAAQLFSRAVAVLQSEDSLRMPPVLIKKLVRDHPDLFLVLLQWLKLNGNVSSVEVRQRILAAMTALAWFGRDNARFVREVWSLAGEEEFWTKQKLGTPFLNKRDFIMYPLIRPLSLRTYLLQDVVENNVLWDDLYPANDSVISKTFKEVLGFVDGQENEMGGAISGMWDSFINRLFWNKSIVLFAQREFINQSFGEFNQLESLEDTNTPWDWDHIFPSEWVYNARNIHRNTRHWNNSIGNLRAESLGKNRRESNHVSPCVRLDGEDTRAESFIKESDWAYWRQIKDRIKEDNHVMLKVHLGAIVNRMCNIYEEWYSVLNVGALFDYQVNDHHGS